MQEILKEQDGYSGLLLGGGRTLGLETVDELNMCASRREGGGGDVVFF